MKGLKIPVETEEIYFKKNGTQGRRIKHSYVALLTEKGGSEVMAVRFDEISLSNNDALREYIQECYPNWNIKDVRRLYEDDFLG